MDSHIEILCILAIAMQLLSLANGYGFCNRVDTTGKAPPYLSNTFQTKLEMKDLIRKQTTEVEMWNDYQHNLSRINSVQEGNEYNFFYSFPTQEIYVITGGTLQCEVINMTKGGDLDLIIAKEVNGVFVLEETISMLRLNPDFGIEYVGANESIRGLPAERWRSCQKWPERTAEMEVNWYFSQSGWDSVATLPVPLRIEITGWSNQSIEPNRKFHMIYDFVFFRPYLQDSATVFQTPRGTFCNRRIKTKKLPELNPILIFTWEIVTGRREEVSNVYYGRFNYDSTQNILRYDFREPGSLIKPPFYNLGTLSIIQDFQSGVAYFVDNVLGNCTARPIGTELLDLGNLDQSQSPGWQLLVMRNPKDLFQFDENYQYEGKAVVRGLPVDVFISLREIKVASIAMNVTFEYYILDESVTEIAIGGSGKIGTGKTIPVQLIVASYSELGPDGDPSFAYYERFNFFNFDSPDLKANPNANLEIAQPFYFDIGSCYANPEDQMNIMIKLKSQQETIETRQIINQTDLFIRATVEKLSDVDLGLVNKIRFQNPKIDLDSKFVYFLATLLDRPNVYYQFARVNEANQTVISVDNSVSTTTEKDCLQSCYDSQNCKSAAYCEMSNLPNNRNCLLSSQFGYKKSNEGLKCSVFVSPINSSNSIRELGIQEAWQQISMAAENNQLIVEVGLPDQQKYSFAAISAENFTIRPDVFNPLTGNYLSRFDPLNQATFNFKESKFKNRKILNKVSADECAKSCIDELEFSCSSAVYCYDLGLCYVTEEKPKEDKSNLLARARCNIYTKNSLSQFTKYPGQSRIFVQGKQPIGEVASAPNCAQMCLDSKNGTCRSFDLCKISEKYLCYLDAGHTTDSESVGKNRTECEHYSQTYEADFTKELTVTNPRLGHLRLLTQVTEQQCARVCVDDVGAICQGYYYCKSSTDCAIRQIGDAVADIGDSGTNVCDYMKRLYSQDGSLYQYTKPQTKYGVSKGVPVGAAVAIYVSLFLIGCILGAVLFVAVQHLRGGSVWRDMKAFVTRR